MSEDRTADDAQRARVVMLGASNLTRGVSTAVQTARLAIGEPLEILASLGHGRSYGAASRVCGRTLPGIVECDLWPALDRGRTRTYALLTDIGNDIAYGHDLTLITGWLEQCLDRLAEVDARIVITGLPVESIDRLGPLRFRLARTLLFPGRPLQLIEAQSRARSLDEAVRRMAEHYGATVVGLPGRWYGLDPVHIRMRHWSESWATVLASWSDEQVRAEPSLLRWLALRTAGAARRRFWGIDLESEQPARRLADGTTVSFF